MGMEQRIVDLGGSFQDVKCAFLVSIFDFYGSLLLKDDVSK